MEKSKKNRICNGTFPWHSGEPNCLNKEFQEKIKHILENVGNIIIKHWHFYGSRAPDVRAFDDFDDYQEYIDENAIPGDIIDVWSMDELLNKNNVLVFGKYPDKDGLIPENGAY